MTKLYFEHDESPPEFGPQQLKALEDQLKCKLPDDYRDFLLRHNGGDPDKKDFRAPHHPGTTWLDHFLPVDEHLATPCSKTNIVSISFLHHAYGSIIPDDCLIIGIVARDDLLLLRLRGEKRGRIDLKAIGDLELDDYDKSSCVHNVAASFSAFLDMLHNED